MTILDATIGRQLPELDRLHTEYEWEGPNRGIYHDADRSKIWTQEQARISLKSAADRWIVIDEESHSLSSIWSGGATDTQLEVRRDHIKSIIDVARSVKPNNLISAYNIGQPQYDLFKPSNRRKRIEADCLRLQYDRRSDGKFHHEGLIESLDFMAPDFTARHAWSWFDRVDMTLDIMRRFQKRIYCYMRTHYSPNEVTGKKLQPIEIGLFKAKIDYLLENTSGIFIWNFSPDSTNFREIPEEHKNYILGLI